MLIQESGNGGDEDPGERQVDGEERFRITVNGVEVKLADPVPVGGQILGESGFLPAGDHVLIQLLCHGTRSVGLDEPVDLRKEGGEAFRAFESDRIFRFTIDGRGYEWGAAKIAEAELRLAAGVCDDGVLVLVRDGKETTLTTQDIVELGEAGTEHLRTGKRLVTLCLDNDVAKTIPIGTYSTEELVSLLGVEAGYLLNVLDGQGKLVLLEPNQKTTVMEGMKFFSQVPCGGSS